MTINVKEVMKKKSSVLMLTCAEVAQLHSCSCTTTRNLLNIVQELFRGDAANFVAPEELERVREYAYATHVDMEKVDSQMRLIGILRRLLLLTTIPHFGSDEAQVLLAAVHQIRGNNF